MIVVPIKSKSFGLKHFFIDGEDYEKIINYTWHITRYNYVQTNIKNGKRKLGFSTYGLHRLITNCPNGMVVDHINHNTLDNRKENLRICTTAQNSKNSIKPKNGLQSKYKGVSFQYGKYWSAQIGFNNKRIAIGLFKNEIEAAKAYNEAAKKYYGEFACLNIIKEN